jgi:hypothetical protein
LAAHGSVSGSPDEGDLQFARIPDRHNGHGKPLPRASRTLPDNGSASALRPHVAPFLSVDRITHDGRGANTELNQTGHLFMLRFTAQFMAGLG